MIPLIPLLLTLLGAFFGGLGPVFVKQGIGQLKIFGVRTWFEPRLLAGVFLYAAAIGCYVIALRQTAVTLLYPLGALSYAWAALFSHHLLHERLNTFKITGVICIILGAGVISFFG